MIADQGRSGGAAAAGGHRHRQQTAAQQGRQLEIPLCRTVGDVDRDAGAAGLGGHGGIDGAIAGGGESQKGAMKITLAVAAPDPFHPHGELRCRNNRRRYKTHPGASRRQTGGLAPTHGTAADNHAQSSGDVDEKGIIHEPRYLKKTWLRMIGWPSEKCQGTDEEPISSLDFFALSIIVGSNCVPDDR